MYENKYDQTNINNGMIFKGVLVGIIILILISIILAVITSFIFNLDTSLLNNIFLIINFTIIAYIGFFIARRVDSNGWLNGGLGGMLFMGIILLLGSISIPISLGSVFLLLILGLITGSIGGIFGINL